MAGFAKDIFISYAHIDNQPLTPGEAGWITRFHATLEALLNMRLGHAARIWRDEKLQGNDVFSNEILDQFAETAVLLSVLTPRYLKSKWCTREISTFCEAAERDGGLVFDDNKARFFKVLKTPVDNEEALPEVAKEVLGYEFYTYDNEVPLELDAAYGEQYGQAYKRKVAQLASDLSQLLQRLESSVQEGSEALSVAELPTVYLAECSYDQKETREILQGELRQHGYRILPDRPLPRDESAYLEQVQSMLQHCALSVHLIGDTYGAVPDGPTQKSVTELQNELAAKKCLEAGAGFQRIIWLPPGSSSDQPQQQAFIEALHRDAEVQYGADMIMAELETLKFSIFHALENLQEQQQTQALSDSAAQDNPKLMYLICDRKDRKATVPLRKFCRDQGYEVAIPAFEGDAAAIRENHLQLLGQCDAVILYYGEGDEAWKRTFDIELQKMPGYRQNKPLLASFSYLAAPRTADKEDLIDMEEPDLIEGFEGFSAAAMQPFVQAMNACGEAP